MFQPPFYFQMPFVPLPPSMNEPFIFLGPQHPQREREKPIFSSTVLYVSDTFYLTTV